MRVPALVVDRDVRNAALHQAARRQAGLAERVAAIAVAHFVFFLRQVEHLARIAQDQLIRLLLGLIQSLDKAVVLHGLPQGVELVEQLAAVALALVGDALGHHAFHREAGLCRVAARGERPIALAQKTVLGKAPLRLREHDIRRNQAARCGLAFKQRDHRAGARVHQPLARFPAGLHRVGRRFMGEDAVRHAADEGILVGLLRQQREQLVDQHAIRPGGDGLIERTAVVVAGRRLGIERVQVRGAAPHPDLNYGLGFGRRPARAKRTIGGARR